MATADTPDIKAIAATARKELLGRGGIVGVAIGARGRLSIFVNEAAADDQLRAEQWGLRHGVKIDMKIIGDIVLV